MLYQLGHDLGRVASGQPYQGIGEVNSEITPNRAARWIATADPVARRALLAHYVKVFRAEDPRFNDEAFAKLVDAEVAHLRAWADMLFPPPSDSSEN